MNGFNCSSHSENCHYSSAVDAYQKGSWDSAWTHIDACLSTCSEVQQRIQSLYLKGTLALILERGQEAKVCLEQVAQHFPSADALLALSLALVKCGEFERAATVARSGLAIPHEQISDQGRSELFVSLGDALRLAEQYEEAADAYRQALHLTPKHADAHRHLGFYLHQQGEIQAAIEHYLQAVEIDPSRLVTRTNLAYALLATGRFKEAWPHFEHRWVSVVSPSGERVGTAHTFPIQRWEGALEGCGSQRLLVLPEQGLGDTIQFCRYLLTASALFEEVGFVCPKPLKRVLADSFSKHCPNLILLDDIPTECWAWDRTISLLSMPMAFDTDVESVPAAIPYLFAEPRAVKRFASRLAKIGIPKHPKIGLVWAGGRGGLNADQWRSIATDQIGKLLEWPGACWVSLQKPDSGEKALKPQQRENIIDWMDEMKDFADTAALIACLDLVISVDTSVAHLAAAMGKPVWLLNRFAGCWRWLHNRDDSPWYPGMRIFTQKERGNWDEVFARVLNELEHTEFNRSSN